MENETKGDSMIDHEAERAALIVRASDAGRTPGEQAAMEEAELREARGHPESAAEWRRLAKKSRAEDLARRKRGSP